MTERVDRFCNKLRESLNTVEEKLAGVQSSVSSARHETRAALQARLEGVRSAIGKRKQEIQDAKARIEQGFAQEKRKFAAEIEEWKTKRERKKLDNWADLAEGYAASAIVIAAHSVEEAEAATLEAIAARRMAEEAAGEQGAAE